MVSLTLHLALIVSALNAAPAVEVSPRVVELTLIDSQPIDHATHHVQGLAVTAGSFWISSVDRAAKKGFVYRVDRATGKIVAERELALGAQFHPGGIDLAGDDLWVPVAEYRPRSSTTVLRLDPTTLATKGSFTVDDHIGCVTMAGEELLAANWDARVFYRLSAAGKKLGQIDNPRPAKYQDLKMLGGLILACGTELIEGQQRPVVDRLDVATLKLASRWQPTGQLRTGGSNFCREGCAVLGESLFLMPEDGPNTTIYRFAVPRQ